VLLRTPDAVPQKKGHSTVVVRVVPGHVTRKVPDGTGQAPKVTRGRRLDLKEPHPRLRSITGFEREALERTLLADGGAIGVCRREDKPAQFLRTRAANDVAERLLMDIPDYEVATAIDDAAHGVAIRMYAHGFKRMPTTNASDFAHVVCASLRSNWPDSTTNKSGTKCPIPDTRPARMQQLQVLTLPCF
jgi:hypothetical protein